MLAVKPDGLTLISGMEGREPALELAPVISYNQIQKAITIFFLKKLDTVAPGRDLLSWTGCCGDTGRGLDPHTGVAGGLQWGSAKPPGQF